MTNRAPSARAQEQALLQKLLHVPVFSRLPTQYLQLLLRAAKPRALAAGASLWQPGEASKGLHILLQGHLKLVVGGKFDQPVQPIAVVGEVNALTGHPYGDQLVAAENCVLLEVGQAAFEQLLLASTNVCQLLCRNILTVIAEKLQAADERISQGESDRQGLAQRIRDAEAEVNALRMIKLR